jgi:hypothetical protein
MSISEDSTNNEIYLVGRFIKETSSGVVWDYQGVFSSEKNAIRACLNKSFFYYKSTLDEYIPIQTSSFPNIIYPCLK